ncbi:MAG: recombination protein RecR [Cellvibrionales bacterium]|nr:recombination protein RecR [Cellvibrionales bacterium]
MSHSPLLASLIESLKILPGVGPKSAQRMALHLLEKAPQKAAQLATDIQEALAGIGKCQQCRNLTETPLCTLCTDPRRNASLLCVVETPMDVLAIEAAGGYRGRYFVLYGSLSPLDGIGPADLGLDLLAQHVATAEIEEVILATNLTVEGEATAHYISEQLRAIRPLKLSRIAQGVPTGGELEYTDPNTLTQALAGRKHYA